MSGGESSGSCAFDTLFKMHVPHILKKIYFFLDYDSFKKCMEVNCTWKALLNSESYIKKEKIVFHQEILEDVRWLYEATKQDRTDAIRSILSSGMVDVDPVNPVDPLERAPLHLAAMNGHADVVEVLLGFGADPNRVEWWGCTPLLWAAENGHKKVVQALLDSGANPNLAANGGETPLHDASSRGHNEVVLVLLLAGAEPNKANYFGRTPLHRAVHCGSKQLVAMLLDFGTDPQIKDNTGRTPLDEAVAWGKRDVEQLLLLHINHKCVCKDFFGWKVRHKQITNVKS